MISQLTIGALAVGILMTAGCIAAILRRDNSIADVCWGIGLVLVGVVTFPIAGSPQPAHWIYNGLLAVWGIRLALHIHGRNRGHGEDRRYAELRRSWRAEGHELRNTILYVFLLQGILIVLISLPTVRVNSRADLRLALPALLGMVFWGVGFFFEAVGDYQLLRFKRSHPEGGVMQSGLWRYTRHPNYFGESLMWWGFFLMAWRGFADSWLIVSPVLITFLLLRVSGVPMSETKRRSDPEFAEYARRTSTFFPRPPKRLISPDEGSTV